MCEDHVPNYYYDHSISLLKDEVGDLEDTVEELESKIKGLKSENNKLEKQVKDLTKENNELKNQIHGIELGIKFATQNRKIMNQNRIQRKRKLHK